MRVVSGWRDGLEIDEKAAKESEMIRMGVGGNSVVSEEAVLQ